MATWLKRRWLFLALAVLVVYPWLPGFDTARLGGQFRDIFTFCILTLGLNVVVGWSGQLQLGIAAFFGIGAYTTGILTVSQFPFQVGFWPALVAATLVAGVAGVLLATPTLRLQGDYVAIVTLGFGEVTMFSLKYLENITNGSKALNPLPAPWFFGLKLDWAGNYRWFYYLSLAFLVLVVLVMRNLESSRLGRTWVALREDEIATGCMGIAVSRARLSAFALGAAVAGLGGALYATSLSTTGGPDSFTFNRSITVLCFLIIGGMGSIDGAILGTFLLMGYDNILTPRLDQWIQQTGAHFAFTDIKLVIFGLTLILMMRFRPEGFLPSRRALMEKESEGKAA